MKSNLKNTCFLTACFFAGCEWFNTDRPLSFRRDLAGKIIVLDFFTYCCVNCLHVLPDLKTLERRFTADDGVIIIGVHSAKFSNERISNNVQNAVQRYAITHPVVNDAEARLWNILGIQCWPTLVVVGPRGNILLSLAGETHGLLLHRYFLIYLIFYLIYSIFIFIFFILFFSQLFHLFYFIYYFIYFILFTFF